MKNNKIVALSLLASLMLVGCGEKESLPSVSSKDSTSISESSSANKDSSSSSSSSSISSSTNSSSIASSSSSSSSISSSINSSSISSSTNTDDQQGGDQSIEIYEVNEENLNLFKNKFIESSLSDEDYYDDISSSIDYTEFLQWDYTDIELNQEIPENMKDKLDDKIFEIARVEHSKTYTYDKSEYQFDIKDNIKFYEEEELLPGRSKKIDKVYYKNDKTNKHQRYINKDGVISYYNVDEDHKIWDYPDYVPYSPARIRDAIDDNIQGNKNEDNYIIYADNIDDLEYYFEDIMYQNFDEYIPSSFDFITTYNLTKQNNSFIYEYDLINDKEFEFDTKSPEFTKPVLMEKANVHMTLKYDGNSVTDFNVKMDLISKANEPGEEGYVKIVNSQDLSVDFDKCTNDSLKVFETKPIPTSDNVPDLIAGEMQFAFMITDEQTGNREQINGFYFVDTDKNNFKLGQKLDKEFTDRFATLKHTSLIYRDKDVTKDQSDFTYSSYQRCYTMEVTVEEGYAVVCYQDPKTQLFTFEEIKIADNNTYDLSAGNFHFVNDEEVFDTSLELKNKGFYLLEVSLY